MTKIVNLNRARKQLAREEKRSTAGKNAALHGLSKAEKMLTATRNEQAQKMLDQHKNENDCEE